MWWCILYNTHTHHSHAHIILLWIRKTKQNLIFFKNGKINQHMIWTWSLLIGKRYLFFNHIYLSFNFRLEIYDILCVLIWNGMGWWWLVYSSILVPVIELDGFLFLFFLKKSGKIIKQMIRLERLYLYICMYMTFLTNIAFKRLLLKKLLLLFMCKCLH